jgi:hypothetical protein
MRELTPKVSTPVMMVMMMVMVMVVMMMMMMMMMMMILTVVVMVMVMVMVMVVVMMVSPRLVVPVVCMTNTSSGPPFSVTSVLAAAVTAVVQVYTPGVSVRPPTRE